MPGWLLLLLAPRWRPATRRIAGFFLPCALAVVYTYLVLSHRGPGGGNALTLDGLGRGFTDRQILLAGWLHYLVLDLLAGTWEVVDSERVGMRHLFVVPCLVLTFFLAPMGVLVYFLLRWVAVRGSSCRALNGFNESAESTELAEDLTQCIEDLRAALARDPQFVDAKGAAASCLVNHSFLSMRTDHARARVLFERSAHLLKEALTAAPDNPRLLWVLGANQFFAPAERGGGPDVAIATYERGLALARQQHGRSTDPLEPGWGEPELLMNLAFANLNKANRDVAAAERYAEQALTLVPHWHYVRDILLPQIRKARNGR